MNDHRSFTLNYDGLTNQIISDIKISQHYDLLNEDKDNSPPLFEFEALWDTGATNSVISEKVIKECHLQPIGMTQVFHAGGISNCHIFLVNIFLPNNIAIPLINVTEGQLTDVDVLIGMDIITFGDFAITNKDDKTTFSCRFPSLEKIDFSAH